MLKSLKSSELKRLMQVAKFFCDQDITKISLAVNFKILFLYRYDFFKHKNVFGVISE